MTYSASDSGHAFVPGVRVYVCEPVLQAFYGMYGTVVSLRVGCAACVEVQMDDVQGVEGCTRFAPHQLTLLASDQRRYPG